MALIQSSFYFYWFYDTCIPFINFLPFFISCFFKELSLRNWCVKGHSIGRQHTADGRRFFFFFLNKTPFYNLAQKNVEYKLFLYSLPESLCHMHSDYIETWWTFTPEAQTAPSHPPSCYWDPSQCCPKNKVASAPSQGRQVYNSRAKCLVKAPGKEQSC